MSNSLINFISVHALCSPCLEFLWIHLFGHFLLSHLCYSPGPFPLFGPGKALTRQQVVKVGMCHFGLRTWYGEEKKDER